MKNYILPFLRINALLLMSAGCLMFGAPKFAISIFLTESACGEALSILCGWGAALFAMGLTSYQLTQCTIHVQQIAIRGIFLFYCSLFMYLSV
jgi:hypothetical protein